LQNHLAHQVSIKSQGRLDGKLMAAECLHPWNIWNFSILGNVFMSFRRQPEPQAKGEQGNAADTAEPKYGEPQQALRQRSLWLDRGQ
jgi:hypothetical protein